MASPKDPSRLGGIDNRTGPYLAAQPSQAAPGRVPAQAPSDTERASARSAPQAAPGQPLRELGDYELLQEIGRGGMGCVYKARHKQLGRIVALKTILAGSGAAAGAVRRFHGEAASAARLDHPGIVPVYEFGEHNGLRFFTMAFVEGRSLADRLTAEGPLDGRQAAFLVEQVARAMAFAHGQDIIHRDLKPANILLARDGTVHVSDFGLARRLGAAEAEADPAEDFPHVETFQSVQRLTAAGAILGTPGYMAPEQAVDARRAGKAADVWALGAVLYACLTARPPFKGRTAVETIVLVIDSEAPAPSDFNPGVDRDLEAICLRCLQKEAAQRYASAEELADDLARWQAGRPAQGLRVGRLEQLRRFESDYPEAVPVLAGLGVTWLGSFQEGLFVACAVAGSRVRLRLPRGGSGLRWALLWAALLWILTQGAYVASREISREAEGRPGLSGLLVMVSGVAGALLGLVLATGARSIEDKAYGRLDGWWVYILSLVLAILSAGGVAALADYTASSAFDRSDTAAAPTSPLDSGLGVVLTFIVFAAVMVGVGALVLKGLLRVSLVVGPSRAWAAAFAAAPALLVVAVGIVAALGAFADSAALQGSDPNTARRRLVLVLDHYGGAVAAALLVGPLGVAVGALLGGVRRWTAGKGRARAWGALGFRLGAAAAAVATLAAVTVWCPPEPDIKLDTISYFGPGPLLTTLERLVGGRLGLPVVAAWWMIFLGKFVALALPMAVGGALTALLLRRVQPS
jgi:tRNA A-37 threonylcarbamoyl transferase component Bud32